jgi:hypothetical protein
MMLLIISGILFFESESRSADPTDARLALAEHADDIALLEGAFERLNVTTCRYGNE